MHSGRAVLAAIAMAGVLATLAAWPTTAADAPGALVRTTMRSTVGVVLDEIPPNMRARVAAALIARPDSFWTERAARQLQLTNYRLVFREYFYEEAKGALPLPPESLWNIRLDGSPTRQAYEGHDVVAVEYVFDSILVSDAASPGAAEPRLRSTGGAWREPFLLPLDPEFLLQRTGFACIDESAYPFASVDSEEIDSFYDQECEVEDGLSNVDQCHATRQPTRSCVDALADQVGRVETSVRFERLPWDAATAARYRMGAVTGTEPDLRGYGPDFQPSRVTYRYIRPSSCEIVERTVGGTGWRQLLQFATSDENVGTLPLTIGGVDYTLSVESGELDEHRLFELSPCHGHYHFRYYGYFRWAGEGTAKTNKQGFCLQSTARVANRETSPLTNRFADCAYQGLEAGWVDQYKIGLSGQWIDTTGLPAGTGTRSFRSNPHGLLCEGTFVDANGRAIRDGEPLVWRSTGLRAPDGQPVEAPLCRLRPNWNGNNVDAAVDTIPTPGRGMITESCTRGQIGPLRNCGFRPEPLTATCAAGERTTRTFALPAGATPQVIRLTDYSHVLGAPIPARWEDSWVPLRPGFSDRPYRLANFIVSSVPRTVTFTCPGPRGDGIAEPGGTFGIYSGPVFPDDLSAPVTLR